MKYTCFVPGFRSPDSVNWYRCLNRGNVQFRCVNQWTWQFRVHRSVVMTTVLSPKETFAYHLFLFLLNGPHESARGVSRPDEAKDNLIKPHNVTMAPTAVTSGRHGPEPQWNCSSVHTSESKTTIHVVANPLTNSHLSVYLLHMCN